MKCYSSQDQDGLKLDISASKCKFWFLKTPFISGAIKNHLALFSPPVNCCKFVSTMFIYHKGLCSASRLPWGILIPTHVMVPRCSFKVWSLEASWNTAERPVTGWIKHCKFPKFWCLGQTHSLFFCYSRLALKDPVLCQASTYEKQRYCMSWQIWRFFLRAERIDLEFQVLRAEHVHHASAMKAFVIEIIMAIWGNACFNTNWMTKAVGKYFVHLHQWPTR